MSDIVRLLRPTVTRDSFGAETTTYTEGAPIHAEVQWKSGSTYETVGEQFPTERIDVIIRNQHEVGEKWRVETAYRKRVPVPHPCNRAQS